MIGTPAAATAAVTVEVARMKQALAPGWLKPEWVHAAAVSVREDGSTIITTAPVDKLDLLLWIKENKYPHVTSRQYRTSLRRLCIHGGEGYRTSALRPDIRELLSTRIEELDRGKWGANSTSTTDYDPALDDAIDQCSKYYGTTFPQSVAAEKVQEMGQKHHSSLGSWQSSDVPAHQGGNEIFPDVAIDESLWETYFETLDKSNNNNNPFEIAKDPKLRFLPASSPQSAMSSIGFPKVVAVKELDSDLTAKQTQDGQTRRCNISPQGTDFYATWNTSEDDGINSSNVVRETVDFAEVQMSTTSIQPSEPAQITTTAQTYLPDQVGTTDTIMATGSLAESSGHSRTKTTTTTSSASSLAQSSEQVRLSMTRTTTITANSAQPYEQMQITTTEPKTTVQASKQLHVCTTSTSARTSSTQPNDQAQHPTTTTDQANEQLQVSAATSVQQTELEAEVAEFTKCFVQVSVDSPPNQYAAWEQHFTRCFSKPELICFSVGRANQEMTNGRSLLLYQNEMATNYLKIDQTVHFYESISIKVIKQLREAMQASHAKEGELVSVPKVWIKGFSKFGSPARVLVDAWVPVERFSNGVACFVFAPHNQVKLLRHPGVYCSQELVG